jgi:hypothetical protein
MTVTPVEPRQRGCVFSRPLKAAEQHRLYALWAVALVMGLRRGEALGLAWADVDLENGRLTVRQALHRVDGELRLNQVKTDASVASAMPAPDHYSSRFWIPFPPIPERIEIWPIPARSHLPCGR